jgi:hypothetical protein
MKCHLCQRKLKLIDDKFFQVVLSCPEDHCEIIIKGDSVVEYKLLWDADNLAKDRYWIYSWQKNNNFNNKISNINNINNNAGTIVKCSTYSRPYKETVVLSLDSFLTLNIKDDVVQLDNIVPRLKKLKAFI